MRHGTFIFTLVTCMAAAMLAGCSRGPDVFSVSSAPSAGPTGSIAGNDATALEGHERTAPGNFAAKVRPAAYGAGEDLRPVPELPPPSDSQGGKLQPISPNDIIEISVFGVDELNRTAQVDSTGLISLPLIGQVKAAGKSERQLEAELEKRYGARYLESPQITVNMKESAGRRVTVDGQVRLPGIYSISSRATLQRALAQARGITKVADPSKVYVFRQVGEKKYVAKFDLDDIRAGKRPDPRIYGGDVVVVFASNVRVAMEDLKAVLGLATRAGTLAVLP